MKVKILGAVLFALLTAASVASARENVYGWNMTLRQTSATTQTKFYVRVTGDITAIIHTYENDISPPNTLDNISVSYDAGTNTTTVVWEGSFLQTTGPPIPHFGFDTGFVGGWSVKDWGWGAPPPGSGIAVPYIGNCRVDASTISLFNTSSLPVRIITGGYRPTAIPYTIDQLGNATLPPSNFTTFVSNVVLGPDSSATFMLGGPLPIQSASSGSASAVYFELEWAVANPYGDSVQLWGGTSDAVEAPAVSYKGLMAMGLALLFTTLVVLRRRFRTTSVG